MKKSIKASSIVFTAFSLILSAGAGPAAAADYDTATLVSTYSFPPVLQEITVEKTGSITGTVVVDTRYEADVSLLFTDENGKERGAIQIWNGGKEKLPAGISTKAKNGKDRVLHPSGQSIEINVKTLTFTIPAKSLDLAPGEYMVVVRGRDSAFFVPNVTREEYSKKKQIVLPDMRVEKVFPGEIKVDKAGAIQITIKSSAVSVQAKWVLVIIDEDGVEVERIAINPKNPKVSLGSLKLSSGEYTLYLEVTDGGGVLRSKPAVLVIPVSGAAGSGTGTAGTGTGGLTGSGAVGTGTAGNGGFAPSVNFPGQILLSEDGAIQIRLNITSEYAKARFTLLIANEDGKVVKRIPINLKSPTISGKGLSLLAGEYSLILEMVNGGKKSYSSAVSWTISSKSSSTFTIPSGASFPGSLKVNSDGTISITLQWKTSYNGYEWFIVVYDEYGKSLKRVSLNPQNPIFSLQGLNLPTGGYTVVIEVEDTASGSRAISLPAFVTVNQTKDIVIFIDGQLQTFQKPPVEIDGRTLVPLRAIFEALGAKVDWDEATQTVTATKDNNTIQLTIGSKVAYKNGKKINLDVPAQLYNGDTTMVPIRFVSEALGAKVGWDAYSNSVVISNE
ncbi:copper amine oxidase N-terminal domain-containing protein [Brevibacillus borstelensis]|uniref:copper amine oxidase N-terminal domain-containing protein n=1 Tax=Brevibacillus borstelensis TaxID=45462 RepID=UPI0030C5BC08